MISSTFFQNLDKCNIMDFRHVMYLSRNNAWVNLGGELYKFILTDIVESIEHPVGEAIYYDKKNRSVSVQEDFSLKLLLSTCAQSISVLGVRANKQSIEVSRGYRSPDFKLDSVRYYYDLCISIGNRRSIRFKAVAHNYDRQFIEQYNPQDRQDAQLQKIMFEDYAVSEQEARLEALQNAIWHAAASGDHQQLALLLNNQSNVNLHARYKGKNIIQVMFAADPKLNVPFNNNASDYKETLNLLIAHGFDFNEKISLASNQTSLDLCRAHQAAQNNLRFYQPYNYVHQHILSAMCAIFGEEMHVLPATLPPCTIL